MEKIKQFIQSEKGKDIMIVLIVILVGLGSFELGRLSKEDSSSGIKIEYPEEDLQQAGDQTVSVISSQDTQKTVAKNQPILNSSGKTFFASNRGTKYYSIGCSAGKTIKQENRVYFATKEDAEQAGYELSSSCN